jgi:AmmeMemoRadiSam system protein B
VCGRAAIDILLRILGRDAAATLVSYDTSGRITGDWDHSVSYAALTFHRRSGTGGA